MSRLARLLLFSGLFVVVFDAAAAFLSRALGLNYGWFSIGSVLIYLAVGVLASKWTVSPVLAGAVAGLVDASAGWLVSWLIGPGRPTRPLGTGVWAVTALVVVLSATFFAGIGYFVESRFLYRFRLR